MDYTKSLCFDKLDLIKGMVRDNVLTNDQLCDIFYMLNDVSHEIDEYIDMVGARDGLYDPEPKF